MYFTALSPNDDVADGFVPLVRAIGAGLGAAQPGFRVVVGMRPSTRIWWFMAFVFSAVVALGILAAMFLSNMGFDDVFEVGLPLLGPLAFGGFGMKMFWPWRKDVGIGAKYLLAAKT